MGVNDSTASDVLIRPRCWRVIVNLSLLLAGINRRRGIPKYDVVPSFVSTYFNTLYYRWVRSTAFRKRKLQCVDRIDQRLEYCGNTIPCSVRINFTVPIKCGCNVRTAGYISGPGCVLC